MKRFFILSYILMLTVTTVFAQQETNAEVRVPQFGYLSYDAIFQKMPELITAQATLKELKSKYEAEAKRSENEFQRKFAEFLQGQKDFPTSIMQKRQLELQDLMDKSVAFRQETQRLLKQAQQEIEAPVHTKLNEAIQAVAAERGLYFVLNTDNHAVPFIHQQTGIDITEAVMIRLGMSAQIAVPELPSIP